MLLEIDGYWLCSELKILRFWLKYKFDWDTKLAWKIVEKNYEVNDNLVEMVENSCRLFVLKKISEEELLVSWLYDNGIG